MALVGNKDLLRLAVFQSLSGKEKSGWMPSQYVEQMGFIVDLKAGTFHVAPHRVDALQQLLDIIIAEDFHVSARTLACLTGSLVSMSLATGPVVRLWMRAMYRDILSSPLLGSTNMLVF